MAGDAEDVRARLPRGAGWRDLAGVVSVTLLMGVFCAGFSYRIKLSTGPLQPDLLAATLLFLAISSGWFAGR